jgi:serine protease inhibitor
VCFYQDYFEGNGIGPALDSTTADFSKISTETKIGIGGILHRAKMIVDEEGTEAAAVTVVEMSESDGESDSVEKVFNVVFDRPFIHCVISGKAKIPVFVGITRDVPEFVERT